MGSEIFNLKSLYLEDTVVRGTRISINNASSTRTIEVNPGGTPVVKTGETGVSKEYFIKSSLKGNDLNGYGTFVQNIDMVSGYTGAQNLSHSDRIRLDGDQTDYTVTGMNGDKVYLVEKYNKENTKGPDVLSGTCSIVKTTLDSLKYEIAYSNITYDKDAGSWGVSGIQMSDPIIAPEDSFPLDTGVSLKFQDGVSKKKPDVASVLSVKKTLVSNNTTPVSDVSLSPIPYPHSSLQVLIGKNGEETKKAVEGEDYIINYTDGPTILYPIPPYEEREVAYIKFLGSMTDEVQVGSIDATFNGNMTIDKETVEGDTVVVRPVQDIVSEKEFSIKVGESEKVRNSEYISNDSAGMVAFVEHSNREELIGALTYPKKLIWDGISVIKGVREEDVNDLNNLVIPGVSGLEGIDYTVYFEDTDSNNLIRDVDFIIDPESGAFRLNQPTKDDEAVLVSYYVEGDDIKDEKIELTTMRLNSFPLISGSLILTKKYSRVDDSGKVNTLTRILVEGVDFKASYVTGHVELFSSGEVTVELKASYTPMAQINCIAMSIPSSLDYKYTIVDDVLDFSQDDIGSKKLIFKVNNPVVSVPEKILFDEDKVDANYKFKGSITPENILDLKIKGTDKTFNTKGSKYDDITKEITLDSSINTVAPLDGDIVVMTYTFQADILPYAPLVLIYTTINAGDDSFLIEGYDKTDSLKPGLVLKVDNRDPKSTNYFVIRNVLYQNQSTKVDIYGSFPEDAIDPSFSVFDDQISWGAMSDDVHVDTSAPIDSESIVFNGGPLFITTNVKPNGLLLIKNQEIYTVTAVSSVGDKTTVGIYPALRTSLSSDIKYSTLPIYDEGVTSLPAKKLILSESKQPAFTLRYNNPAGFEGSAKVFYIKDKIIIKESVSGIENPVPYEFIIGNFQDIYTLAKTIQATKSTFKDNVHVIEVPDYNPFTIAHNGDEEYYLGDGIWNPKTITPFEEEEYKNLPHTFNVTPELFKYDLIELFSGKNEFTVKSANVVYFFQSDTIIAFINKISGRLFLSRVSGAEFLEGNTIVSLSSVIPENMVDPYIYVCPVVSWVDVSSSIVGIDHNSNSITFSGNLAQNIRVGTLLTVGSGYIYQVGEIIQGNGSFQVVFNSDMDPKVTAQSYSGYIKISSTPVSLLYPGPQPYIQITYEVLKGHVGYATVKIDSFEIATKEVVDNFNTRDITLKFQDYDTYEDLFRAIESIDSCVGGKPYKVIINENFSNILKSNFENYALNDTKGLYVPLPSYFSMATAAFDITYTPDGYIGAFFVKITSEHIYIKEAAINPTTLEGTEKETIIKFSDTGDLFNLINMIPSIPSVIEGRNPPFHTVAKNAAAFGLGKWDVTHITNMSDELLSGDLVIYGLIDTNTFVPVGILNERSLVVDTDYSINNGIIELTTPVASLERYQINYMGLDNLFENEGDSITCTCKFITSLPVGYRLDVYMEYLNEDQFYIQKLTERKFTEIVTVPQIEQLTEQKGSAGGQGADSGSSNNSIPNYEGGIADLNYLLRDEYIKKQLYLRFYKWYKQRLRGLSSELQLGLGFKFGHSNAVGEVGGYYSLEDQYVETEDYTLTKDADIDQIENGFSKFFPIDYEDQAPKYYDRFGKESLSFNEVYCCNIVYRNDKNQIVTVGVVKSDRPYWNKTSDLVFKVWEDQYINKSLVGSYSVDVPVDDRSFGPSNYTFLRVIDTGDQIKINNFKNYYGVSEIVSPSGKTYEYIRTSKPFTDKGIKTFNIVDRADAPFNVFMDNLPFDGYRIWIQRPDKEDFPMFDDAGSLGATAYSDSIEGLVKDSRRIKKISFSSLLKLFFPAAQSTKNFSIHVKKDSEAPWELLGSIDLSKLSFKEERNIDDVMDALRYDFTEKFVVPVVPPITVYDIKEDSGQGFFRYFYLSLEKVYDKDSKGGYYSSIVIRAKDRNWWFKIVNGGETPIIGDYGYSDEKVYENFYDPDNIYKRLLLEKQAWQTEELIVRDLYDYSDKIARAFEDGDLNRKNSKYQGYLAAPDGGTVQGISDILRIRIPAYERQLRFLIDTAGPVFRTLYPDLVHAEDVASPEIATTYNQTMYAWNLYNTFYAKLGFYYNLNENNNYVWKNDYIRWAMSIERGVLYQEKAKDMYKSRSRNITVGLLEVPTIKISLASQTLYTIVNPMVTVSSTYEGKYIQINYGLINNALPEQGTIDRICIVFMYTKSSISSVPTIVYKSISEVCTEISDHSYDGIRIFSAENVFGYFDNDVLSKSIYITNSPISPVDGIELKTTNVADHRVSDPRILFINKNIEDRVYTHGIRELPGFNINYFGNYYSMKYGTPGMYISANSYYIGNLRYGIFKDDTGEKILSLAYEENGETIYTTYLLYTKTTNGYSYKKLYEIADEISSGYAFVAEPVYSLRNTSCENFMITSNYVAAENNSAVPYIATDSTYSSIGSDVNQLYLKSYVDSTGIKKLDIIFYDLIADGSTVYKSDEISDTFTFSYQKSTGAFKTLSEISSEISNFKYRGESIVSASSVYEAAPKGGLSSTFVIADSSITPIGIDWESTVYVDTYVEAIGGTDDNSRRITDLKNTVFCFPMYTANGNPNKVAIEDIPVSGKWVSEDAREVIEVGCIDGFNWSLSFSDFDSGDYKSYMTPQDIIDIIDSGETLTEDQYNQIKVIEDRPSVAVLKELVLTREGTDGTYTARFNLRKYGTINDLIEAVVNAKFNAAGEQDPSGIRSFFTAKLIGDPEVEGKYKSNELDTVYVPVVKSFTVLMDDGTTKYMNNHVIGWRLTSVNLKGNVKYKIKMSEKRYSYGESQEFLMADPETAYIDTLYNNPQGFRRDILAFDIYSWDYNAQYEIRDNWIYFKSDSVDYSAAVDIGQPDKTIGLGIPLAGSGHSSTAYRESILTLVNRINENDIVNKWFYANLKFTRYDKVNPGYFEYNYLPNCKVEVPRAEADLVMLKDDYVMKVRPKPDYRFTASNISIHDSTDTMDLSCDWELDYTYEQIFFFNDPANRYISDLADRIQEDLPPQIAVEILSANFDPDSVGWLSGTLSRTLLPTFVEKKIGVTGVDLKIYSGTSPSRVLVNAIRLKINVASGSNFTVRDATYVIPRTRDRIIIKINLTYHNTYTLTGYNISGFNISLLGDFIASIRPYTDEIFGSLFTSEVLANNFNEYEASRLLDTSSEIYLNGAYLKAKLNDITAFKVINMASNATISVGEKSLNLISFNSYSKALTGSTDLHAFVESIKGDFFSGFLSCDVLPIIVPSTTYGGLDVNTYTLTQNNTPAHVYFGVLGDIKFIQISDHNLHIQYNYIKERLGMPWADSEGNLDYDYYTPETYNENNPCAIDLKNFLGYLRTTRYNQIKNSLINEATIDNKYLWLYMKFHKEFGCDQRAKALKSAIEKGNTDLSTLSQLL